MADMTAVTMTPVDGSNVRNFISPGLPPGTPVWSGLLQVGHIAYENEDGIPIKLDSGDSMMPVRVAWHMTGREMLQQLGRDAVVDPDRRIPIQFGGNPTTGDEPLAEARSPVFKAEERTLYHYTSMAHWLRIQKDKYIQPHSPVYQGWPDIVALTDEPNLTRGSAPWADDASVDKTKVRITVRIRDAVRFLDAARVYSGDTLSFFLDPKNADDSGNIIHQHWWVSFYPIQQNDWIEVRVGDTVVETEVHIDKYRPRVWTDEDHPWLNNSGQVARCDFCHKPSVWRYFCRPFTLGDWKNGGDDLNPQDADWAACFKCGELIEAKNRKALIARNKAELQGSVILSGKHGTETGKFDPEASADRIRGFFRYATGKRIFVGACDFCGKHTGVKWFYTVTPYTFRPSWDRATAYGGSDPWIACEVCGDMVERGKRSPLADRAVRTLREKYGVQARTRPIDIQAIIPWLEEFYKHRNGKRTEIPDRPVPLQQAPIAAQAALEQQVALLNWLETPGGGTFIKEQAERYSGRKLDNSRVTNQRNVWSQPLRYGDPYYWEPRIADAIRQAAAELRETESGWPLDRTWVPAPQGFFYSDVPLSTGERTPPVRAIGWTLAYDIEQSEMSPTEPGRMASNVTLPLHGGGDLMEAEGLVVTFWSEQQRQLRPTGVLVWMFGITTTQLFSVFPNSRAAADQNGEQPEILAAMLQFIRQRVVVSSHRMPVSSALRKRIERDQPKHTPAVRVITLRRVQAMDYRKPDEESGRHLTVQFRVPGRWRYNHCFNPHGHADAEVSGSGCKDHGPVYVHPYWKGPADAPVKQSRWGDVFDVAR